MKKAFFAFLFFALTYYFSMGQSKPKQPIDLDQFILDLFGQPTDNARYDVIFENLFQYYREPLDINKATKAELENLFILSPLQINNLLTYRANNGNFLSEYELQAVPDFTLEIIEKILPFIKVEENGMYVDNRSLWNKVLKDKNNYLILRYQRLIERQKGFTVNDTLANQAFIGSPEALYGRFRSYQKGDYSIGATTQKDIGEQIAWNPNMKQNGMDYYSAHFAIYERGKLKALNIGDYQIMIGQGIAMSGGFFIGKGAETVTTAKRSNQGLRPYTAALETNFLRGAAATLSFGRFDFTPFASSRALDANIVNLENSSNGNVTNSIIETASAIQLSGFHRTKAELQDKNSLREHLAGTYLQYISKNKDLKIGINGIYFQYDPPIMREKTVTNQFYFSGKENYNIGIDYSYNWKNFSVFGEYARNIQNGNALLSGVMGSLHHTIDMALLFRHYDPSFFSSYGNSFGESSVNRNEQGMYWGIKYSPSRKVNVAAFYDIFKYPWLSSRSDAPIDGYEYLIRFNYKPTKKISLYAQYREENKPINKIENDTPFDYVEDSKRSNYLINLDYKAEKIIGLKSRVMFSEFYQVGRPKEHGFVIFQDVDIDIDKKVKISGRFALFDANDYNTRLYVYEKNVLWAFAMPVYYGQGVRNYIMVQYKINRNLDIWLRIARFEYRNVDKISSGVNEINGNSKTEVTVQLKYDF